MINILDDLSLFFDKTINEGMLNSVFCNLVGLYYSRFKDFNTKKEFLSNSTNKEIISLIKKTLKAYPYLKKLSCWGGFL